MFVTASLHVSVQPDVLIRLLEGNLPTPSAAAVHFIAEMRASMHFNNVLHNKVCYTSIKSYHCISLARLNHMKCMCTDRRPQYMYDGVRAKWLLCVCAHLDQQALIAFQQGAQMMLFEPSTCRHIVTAHQPQTHLHVQ